MKLKIYLVRFIKLKDSEFMKILFKLFLIILTLPLHSQTLTIENDTIKTDIFDVIYSEELEQPLWITYKVLCPMGTQSRSGLNFYTNDSIHTSNNEDYKDNIWDKGHLAPASAFNCDRETLKKTFTYLNCVLQHEGLNRGPWKELERFEVGLSKIFESVIVEIKVCFEGELGVVSGGATIPSGFKKTIKFDNKEIIFYFPNVDVSGKDWGHFKIEE
ncbi:DNA/RNA non-specific endonuclease [bacterium]|jgi:DNA/RNA endonuclease G (NUC1)|nr:DNA/RNA non-specific endonuclease [bacterium]